MREGWRDVQLGVLIERRKDFDEVRPHDEYRILGVQRSGWGFVEREPIRGSAMKFSKLMRIRENDLVYRTITAFEAPSAVAGAEQAGRFVTPQAFPVYRIDNSQLLPDFMRLLTTLPAFHDEMSSRCSGSVLRRKTLAPSAFESIPIELPPLREQQRIIDLMCAIDEAMAAADALRERVVAGAASVITRPWPSSVERVSLGSVFSHVIGGAWGDAPGVEAVDVLALGPRSFAGRTNVDPLTATQRSLAQKRAHDRTLAYGDIVLERSGGSPTQPVGRVIRMNCDIQGIVPSDFQRLLRPDRTRVDPDYLFWQMWANYEGGRTLPFQKATTSIRNLNIPDYLEQTELALPSMAEQREHAALAAAFERATESSRAAIDRLTSLRSNVLTALLSGVHEIPESYDALIDRAQVA